MQQRESALDAEGDEDQPSRNAGESDEIECQRSGFAVAHQHTGQQQHARKHLDDQIAQRGGARFGFRIAEDQEHRGDCGHFPENEQRNHVAAERRPDRAARVQDSGDRLAGILDVQREQQSDEGGQMEDVAEHLAERVDAQQRQVVSEQGVRIEHPVRQHVQVVGADQRDRQHDKLLDPPARDRDETRADVEDQEGCDATHRSILPCASRVCAFPWRRGRARRTLTNPKIP